MALRGEGRKSSFRFVRESSFTLFRVHLSVGHTVYFSYLVTDFALPFPALGRDGRVGVRSYPIFGGRLLSAGEYVCRGNAFVQGYGNGCSYMAGSRSFGRFGTYRREKPAHVFALRFVVGCRACGAEGATGRVADFSGRRLRDGCGGTLTLAPGMARGIVAVSDRTRPGRSDRGGKNFGRRIAAEFLHGGRAGSLGFAVRPAGSRGRVCRFFPCGTLR